MEQSGSDPHTELISKDDKLVAMLAHLTFTVGYILVPLLAWLYYRKKSRFVKFHSMQALIFDIVFSFGLLLFSFIMSFAVDNASNGNSASIFQGSFASIFETIVFIAFLMYFLGGIYLLIAVGISANNGGFRKYPVIGKIVYAEIYESRKYV